MSVATQAISALLAKVDARDVSGWIDEQRQIAQRNILLDAITAVDEAEAGVDHRPWWLRRYAN